MQSLNQQQRQKIIDSEEFFYFTSEELRKTINHSTNEEIANFAFGSIEKAVIEFINNTEKK